MASTTATDRRPLAPLLEPESRARRIAKRAFLAALAVHVTLAIAAGYRAIVQVYDVRVVPPVAPLAPGVPVAATATTSGRTHVTLRLALVQGVRERELAVGMVESGREPAYDPRPRRGRLTVTLAPAMLTGFAPGAATLRATAIGRSQWLRIPPPTVATLPVTIAP